jgi:hypothetical protein
MNCISPNNPSPAKIANTIKRVVVTKNPMIDANFKPTPGSND